MGTPAPGPGDVTRLLAEFRDGDQEAGTRLMQLVYRELRNLARHYMRLERPNHTLQATALVHEAYVRLVAQHAVTWQNRAHFFGIAAQVMRRVLVSHARKVRAEKRGGGLRVTLDERAAGVAGQRDLDLVALDDALARLALLDQRQARIVELRFFGGLDIDETAEAIGVSPATVKRQWLLAKVWLHRELTSTRSDQS